MSDLGAIALALPGVERGIACAGTALESATYGVRGKTFLFVPPRDARLELAASADDARGLGFAVGKNGWATLPPARVLQRWIAESHALLGGAAGRAANAASAKKVAKKPAKKPTRRGTR